MNIGNIFDFRDGVLQKMGVEITIRWNVHEQETKVMAYDNDKED